MRRQLAAIAAVSYNVGLMVRQASEHNRRDGSKFDKLRTTMTPENSRELKSKRTGRRIFAGFATVLLAILVALYFGIPQAARYLTRSELASIGINVEGSSTIDWNIFSSRMSAGPLEFSSADAEPGLISRLALQYDLRRLFERRASLETVTLEGVDLLLKRKTDGNLTLNGIDLAAILAPKTEPSGTPKDEMAPWEFGTEEFSFLDSKLVFIDAVTGGTAVFEIERLRLRLFRTWDPATPGKFELIGSINDIQLVLKGEVQPFSDEIELLVEGDLSEATLEKIAQFTGPYGLERENGVMSARLETRLKLVDGRIEATTEGRITIAGIDVGGAEIGGVELDELVVDLDISTVSRPDRTNHGEGSIGIRLGEARLFAPDGTTLSLEGAELQVTELDIDRRARGEKIQAASGDSTEPSPVVLSLVELFVDLLVRLIEELANDDISGRGFASFEHGAIQVEIPPLEPRPGLKVTLNSGQVDLRDVSVESIGGNSISVRGGLGAVLGLSATTLSTSEGDIHTDVGSVEITVTVRKARDQDGVFNYDFDISADAQALKASMPGPQKQTRLNASLRSLDVAFNHVVGTETPTTGSVSSRVETALEGFEADIPQVGGSVAVAADRIIVSLSSLESDVAPERGSLNLSGTSSLSALRATVPPQEGHPELALGIGELVVDANQFSSTTTDAQEHWKGSFDLGLDAIAAEVRSEVASTVNVGSLTLNGVEADQSMAVGIDDIAIGGLQADLTLDAIKAFEGGEESDLGEENEDGEKNERPGTPTFRFDQFDIGSGSTVRFTDTSVDPPATLEIDLNEIRVTNIDSRKPDQQSEVTVDLKINAFTGVSIAGWATPLNYAKPDFDLKADVDQLELPVVSPYLDRMLGLHLNKGTLSLSANGVAKNSALNGEVWIAVDDLEVSPVTPQDAADFKDEFHVSVEFATGVLKDKEGRIELTLPITGTVDDPKIRLGDVVKKALRGSVRTVFRNKFRKDEDDTIFEPVPFAPGSTSLDDQARNVADRYVEMLNAQKELTIYVCGQATAQDFAKIVAAEEPSSTSDISASSAVASDDPEGEQEKAMVELAMTRTEVVRGYFIQQKGIDTDRIAQCRVSSNAEDPRPPRVELSM